MACVNDGMLVKTSKLTQAGWAPTYWSSGPDLVCVVIHEHLVFIWETNAFMLIEKYRNIVRSAV
jgi:hypothetical protein